MSDIQVPSPTPPPAWPAYAYDDEIDLRAYVEVLRRRWLMVIGIPVVAVIVAALLSFFVLPPEYEATAGLVILKARTEVEFEPKIRTELGQSLAVDVKSRREALQALATSRPVAALVIERLGDQLPEEERQVDELLDSVSSKLTGDLLTIQAKHTDPDLAAGLANAWAETYVTYVNPLFSDVAQTPDTLAPQVQNAETTYQVAEEALVQFLADNPIQRLQREVGDLQSRIDKQYTDLRALDYLIDDVEALQAQLAGGVASSMPTTLGNSLAVVFLRARTFTASSRAQLETQLQLDPAAWTTAPQDAPNWQRELEALLTILTARRDELDQTVQSTDWEQELLALQSELERQQAQKRELINSRDLAWDTYTSLRRKYTEVKVATEAPDLQVSIAMHADVPEEPVGPRKMLNLALAGALGLMVGVFGAFFVEFLEEDEQEEGEKGKKRKEEKGVFS
ncbi:MAG: GumC family protein [Anaerolineae bacterium]